jgi:hypothetical protein
MPHPIAAALATTLGAGALLGFLLALTVNALTFASVNLPARVPIAGPVHIGAIVAVGAAVLLGLSGLLGSERQLWAWPRWVLAALLAIAAYAAINGALNMRAADTSTAEPRSSGSAVVEQSADAFTARRLHRTRTLSSIWMTLYLGAALFLLAPPTRPEV